MKKLCTSISHRTSDAILGMKSSMSFSDKGILQNQFGGLLAYDWLYSRKPKKPV